MHQPTAAPGRSHSGEDGWHPFGLADEEYEPASGHAGVRIANLSLRRGRDEADQARTWLRCAMLALGLLAGAAAAVSFAAQYRMVFAARHLAAVAALEAGIPDAAALIFAALGIALALHGKRAIRPRLLNVGAVATSITMNLLAAGPGWRDLAIWVLPPVAYALASDTAIGVVRAHAIARQRALREDLADEDTTPLAAIGAVLLWLLRLALDPRGTLGGLRRWVLEECPPAPGARALTVAQQTAADAQADAELAREERDQAVTAFDDASAALERVRGERDQAITRGATVRALPRGETKTARFLALVAERHGPLAGFPLGDVSRVAGELAPEVDLNAGAARTALRARVLAEQDGSPA